jgi:hypothetical protein
MALDVTYTCRPSLRIVLPFLHMTIESTVAFYPRKDCPYDLELMIDFTLHLNDEDETYVMPLP